MRNRAQTFSQYSSSDCPHLFQAPPQKQLVSFTRRRPAPSWWLKASGWCWSVSPVASPLRRSYGQKMARICAPTTTRASCSATYSSTRWAKPIRALMFAEQLTGSAQPALRRCFMTYKCLVSEIKLFLEICVLLLRDLFWRSFIKASTLNADFYEWSFVCVLDLIISLTPVWRTENTGVCMCVCARSHVC